ncbi:MAG: hypothetical protein IKX91_02420 [Firmicutes bacterium]|nr:hypothetical protein [Bacillota bacterium]
MRFRAWLSQFMEGRYGQDDLSRFLLPFGFVTFLAGYILVRKIDGGVLAVLGTVLYYAGTIAIFWNLFRTWSRNLEARRRENEKFIALKRRISGNLHRDRKNYSYFSCPSCRTLVRVPKGKGNIRITCPKCGETFVRKS